MRWTERIESLKAGLLGAIATGTAFGVLEGTMAHLFPGGVGIGVTAGLPLVLRLGIAIASGFLFGVTYRYIIRQDDSTHLKSGAVLAFGLVRGLAQVEDQGAISLSGLNGSGLNGSELNGLELAGLAGLMDWRQGGAIALLLGESWVLFAIARLVLDFSLRQGWLQPFQGLYD